MRYGEELVEEVRSRNDIVDVISSYVRLNQKGSNYFGLCPFHNEKTGSFSVTPSKQMFYCFGCHEGGNVITFIQKYDNCTFTEALKTLADRAGVALPDNMSEEDKRKENRRGTILDINKEAGKYYFYQLRSPEGQNAYEYLKGRGLSDETMKKFGLGYARSGAGLTYRYLKGKGYSDELLNASGLFVYREERGMMDKFWNRVIFPIMDTNHRIIAFGGRVMDGSEPKYLNSPETEVFNKSRNLYGLNIAKSSKAKNIIICEGYMDVISLHQAGFTQAVASLGTALTSGHANLLARYARESQNRSELVRYKDILLCFDSDGAGIDAAKRGIKALREIGLTPKVINMKPYKDPDEFIKNLGAEEFQKRIDEAENGFMFEIRMLEAEYDLKDPTGKSKFMDDVARRILQFDNPVERDSYTERICEKYNVTVESLTNLVKKHAMSGVGVTTATVAKSSVNIGKTADDSIKKAQGSLLNWMCETPALYKIVKEHLTYEDFTEGVYRDVAKVLFEQLEEGEPKPERITSLFTDEEELNQVAAIFHQGMEYYERQIDREAALRDLIIKIKENALKNNITDSNVNVDDISVMVANRKKFEELRKIKINLSNI